MDIKSLSGYFLWPCWVPTISVLIFVYCYSEENGVKLLKMLMLGVRSPQLIACGVGASVSRIELYNSDRFCKFVYVFIRILLLLFTSVYYMYELDPGIHMGMHLVYFSKTRCDTQRVVALTASNNTDHRMKRWSLWIDIRSFSATH
jgi:hypothetical protein